MEGVAPPPVVEPGELVELSTHDRPAHAGRLPFLTVGQTVGDSCVFIRISMCHTCRYVGAIRRKRAYEHVWAHMNTYRERVHNPRTYLIP
jgi:hypothetical protein